MASQAQLTFKEDRFQKYCPTCSTERQGDEQPEQEVKKYKG